MVILALCGGEPFAPQCSLIFLYTLCGEATSSLVSFLLHSHFLWPYLPYLKHFTISFIVSCLLTSLTPHCITLLARVLNLFSVFLFSSSALSPLFLQFLARWLNCLHFQHFLSCLPSNSDLILVSACRVLSILLNKLLYTSKDMMCCI